MSIVKLVKFYKSRFKSVQKLFIINIYAIKCVKFYIADARFIIDSPKK